MRGVYVDLNINGPNQWTQPLALEKGDIVAVSAVPIGFAGTVFLQRSVDGVNFWDVQTWTDEGIQGSYDVEVPQLLRFGIPTGSYSLGTIYVRLER